MKRESSSPRSSHRRSILRSRQESAPVDAADKSAKRRRALQRQPKEALAEVAKKSTQWSSQGRWSSIRAAEGAATKSSRRSSSSSDRSSRTAATKTTWTEGQLPEHAERRRRTKHASKTRLDQSDKCRAKRTGFEISSRGKRTVTDIKRHNCQKSSSCTRRAGRPHVRLEASISNARGT